MFFMAKVISIANRLQNEPTVIELGNGIVYTVNDSYKNMMMVNEMFNSDDISEGDAMMKAIELTLGKKARGEVENMPLGDVQVVFIAVMAAIQKLSYEDMEARFRAQTAEA
jgi:hypothetical protein